MNEPLRYIPVAIYTIGKCHYGHTEPYTTVKVLGDNKADAMIEAIDLLKPSLTETIRYVSIEPNPEHIQFMKSRGF